MPELKPTHLIQPRELYGPKERKIELLYCWNMNAKIFGRVTSINGRPTFGEMFTMCKPDHINVIANSDIYFDETLKAAQGIKIGEVYALSRWDKVGGDLVPYHRRDSQDAWIIYGQPERIPAPYQMGVPGVDNVLVNVLRSYGYKVTNPCKSIRAIHVHESGYRTYGEGRGKPKPYRYAPPYDFAEPCSL